MSALHLPVAAALLVAALVSPATADAGEKELEEEKPAVEISTVIRFTPVEERWVGGESPFLWLNQGGTPSWVPWVRPSPTTLTEEERESSGLGGLIRRWLDALVESGFRKEPFWSLANGQVRPYLGRAAVDWGPGQFGQLAPASSTPLDWLLFDYSQSTLRYRQGVAAVDWSSDRYLLAHRLEWDLGDSPIRVGISECMTINPGFHFHPGYLVPFTPYSFWSWLDRRTNPDQELYVDGTLGFDLQMRLPNGQFYSEIVFGDRSAVLPDGRSWERLKQAADALFPPSAWLVGWSWELRTAESEASAVRPRLQIEYAHAGPQAYQDVNRASALSVGGRPPGYWLGPDSDMLVVHLGWTEIRPLRLPSWVMPGYSGEGAEGAGPEQEAVSEPEVVIGLGQPVAWELSVGREEIENAVARMANGDGTGVELVPVTAVAKGTQPAGGDEGQKVTVPATVSTYGEVRFTRRGASESAGEGAGSEKSVRVAVGQTLNWNEVKVDIQLGIERTVNRGSRPGAQDTGLVAEVKITIPLGS